MFGRLMLNTQQLPPLSKNWWFVGVFGLLVGLPGCGSSTPTEVHNEKSAENLRHIGAAYSTASFQLQRPPSNVNELKEVMKKTGIADPDATLRSPDDNEDYVIVWNVNFMEIAKTRGNVDVIIAYEQKGKNGRRNVLKLPAQVLSMTDEQFRAAPFPPGHTPAIAGN